MNYKKQKRIPLSMIRLYKLAQKFAKDKKQAEEVASYLKFVFEHKNDTL